VGHHSTSGFSNFGRTGFKVGGAHCPSTSSIAPGGLADSEVRSLGAFFPVGKKCSGQDSNLHALRHTPQLVT